MIELMLPAVQPSELVSLSGWSANGSRCEPSYDEVMRPDEALRSEEAMRSDFPARYFLSIQ